MAHVEASTTGSIILAGVLLKIGGLGVLYLTKYNKLRFKWSWLILGIVALIFIILEINDLKMIIAYSPTAHMTVVFVTFMFGSFIRLKGGFITTFYHGVTSPLIF